MTFPPPNLAAQPAGTSSPSPLPSPWQAGRLLLLLWLGVSLIEALWLWQDQAPPRWDQADHLTRALNYWRLWQQPALYDDGWWRSLWQLSPSYRAPFVYLMTVPLLQGLGRGFDQAVLVNSVFHALLLVLVYALGQRLFDRRTGLWAAAASSLVPIFWLQRTDYLLDYGLVLCVLLGFTCLSYWRTAGPWGRWLWALGFGVGLGLTVLTKPTGILFFVVPLGWLAVGALRRSLGSGLAFVIQGILAAAIALLICGPWIQTNWLTILTSSGSSSGGWVANELDPASPRSIWSYYARMLPRMISPMLLWGGLLAWLSGLLAWRAGLLQPVVSETKARAQPWPWLLAFGVGTYVLLSLIANKDPRHSLPWVPVVVIILVRGFTAWRGRQWRWLWLGLLGSMLLLAIATLFPVAQVPIAQVPGLKLVRHPYRGPAWPHPAVIETVLAADPYLRSTIGVLPNTEQVNPMNVDFYGALQDFQVFGREVGFSPEFASRDARSLSWVLTKSGEQGPQSSDNPAKANLQSQVEQSPAYQTAGTWPLPDGTDLTLYRRQPAVVEAALLSTSPAQVQLVAVTTPTAANTGSTVAVTYGLEGPWAELADGLLLLSWQSDRPDSPPVWIHDHGIGLGNLYAGATTPDPNQALAVTERLGMLIPAEVPSGTYRLSAQYLNRRTRAIYPLALPRPIELTIRPGPAAPTAPTAAAPEADLVGQLHQLSQGLANGQLEPIFNTVSRINQYDPLQDYLAQAEAAMVQRSQLEPSRLEWAYTRLMAQVLQQRAEAAIATLTQITQVAPNNPYHWLYLGFVQLYRWHPGEANQALSQAEQLEPDLPELKLLQAIAAAQRLNLPRAWRLVQQSGLLT